MKLQKLAKILPLLMVSSSVFAADRVDTQYTSTSNKIYNVSTSRPQLKIANYNIAGGLRNHKVDLDKVANAIKKLNPDIITLEEVDQNTDRSGHVDQPKRSLPVQGCTMPTVKRLK